ncbi:putative multi antimicrobial extrusion protein [Rosa chinensis]|uniref:Protein DETOXIFICATION n=1 Tax=Rosa chinensis TaxID=74649 RepID=A0A2P6QTN7_ROSCH|nr:protein DETOXIFICATION 16 [Rosa chinensis]PRQ37514.1 putative multi antimicrobial extrusion protein [Rosa chinensis]
MDAEEQRGGLESPLIPDPQEHALQSRKGLLNKDEIVEEVKKQLLLAGPLVSSNFLLFGMQVISVMYVGHLGELSLAGASMATSFASVTGLSLIMGMCSALDTFCGQSYGAKQYRMLGIHMQRAMLVLLLVSIPLATIWANAGRILQFLGQDPEISAAAGDYARLMIPCIFAYAILQCHARFLQTQNNVVPMIVSTGTATLLHLLICWLLVYKTSLGYKGAAVANAITYWINALLLFLYVRISPSCKSTWTGFSKEAFHGLPTFLRLSIPSAVMLSLEIWSFEMLVLVSGFLPNPKLETSVLSISLNTCAMAYMIPLAFSGAASTRVSNQLGAGQPRLARLAACVSLCLVVIEGIVVAAVMILGRKVWGYCYSNEKQVVNYVSEMLIFVAISHFVDGPQSVLSGVIRGSGQQKIGAYVNLGAYYLLGIPIGLVFAFGLHIGGKGLWIGIVVALFVQALCLAIIVICTDWDKEVKKASDRVHNAVSVGDVS